MMEFDAIVYTSKAGHTKRYAEMLGNKTGKPAFSLEKAKKKLPYACKIIYMGWIHASHIQKYKNAAKCFSIQCVCAIGLCDTGTLTSEVRKATAVPDSIPLFTIQGGMNRSGLKGMDKLLISMLAKGLASQKELSEQDSRTLELLNGDFDLVNEHNLKEVLAYISIKISNASEAEELSQIQKAAFKAFVNIDGKKLFYEEFGSGEPVFLLHGNTVSGKFFTPIIPKFAEKYRVITLDFLGCGRSDRISEWPKDLWFEWSVQAQMLINHLGCKKVNVIGCSGGAMVAVNLALECPELVNAVVADSFEGLTADAEITDQIRTGRSIAKQNEAFCAFQKRMHGADWESVFDADTDAVVHHALYVKNFFHKDLKEMKVKLLLTGSAEDEMFPKGHYEALFADICGRTPMAKSHLFEHGGHPAMMSNMDSFVSLCDKLFARQR